MKQFRNTRADLIGLKDTAYSLNRGRICDVPITASGELLMRSGVEFRFAPAVHFHNMSGDNIYCYASRAVVDGWLDRLVASGVEGISCMQFDQAYGPSGGRPNSMWIDTSASAPDPEFYTGDASSAGWDYFMEGCRLRGLYVAWRYDQWGNVFRNRGITPPAHNTKFFGMWDQDGTLGTANFKQFVIDHIVGMLNRTNGVSGLTLNGAVSGDYTLWMINPTNEMGHAKHWRGTTSTSSPTSNTFDRLCSVGDPSASGTMALHVAWRDANFVAWHNATFGAAPTLAGVTISVMPCRRYTGLIAGPLNNIAARGAISSGTTTEQKRVEQYWDETEAAFHTAVKAAIQAVAPHVLYCSGQGSYIGHAANVVSDFVDFHSYHGILGYTGNTQSISGCTSAWAANVVTVTNILTPDSDHPLRVGQAVTLTCGNTVNLIISTCTATSFTAATTDNTLVGAASVVLNGSADPRCYLHKEPDDLAAASSTAVECNIEGVDQTVIVRSMEGQSNYGNHDDMRGFITLSGKPGGCTELGRRGLGLMGDQHFLNSMSAMSLQNRWNFWMFALLRSSDVAGFDGNHPLQSQSSFLLDCEMMALMSRYGGMLPLPTTDSASITDDYIRNWERQYGNTFGWASGGADNVTSGWTANSGRDVQYHSFLTRRLRYSVGGSDVPSTASIANPTSTGAYVSGLSDPNTYAFYSNRAYGYWAMESPTMMAVQGRIPAASSTTAGTAGFVWTNGQVDFTDGKHRYGRIVIVSADGSPLGAAGSKARLFSWSYSRAEDQQYSALSMDGSRNANINYRSSQYGLLQTGVVMLEGLRVRMNADSSLKGYVLDRYASKRLHPTFYKSSQMWIHPDRPRVFIE